MKALSDFFFHLYAKAIVLLVFLLIELLILVRNLKTHTPTITISHYLQLIEEKNPTVCFSRTLNMADQPECRVCLSELQEGDRVRTLKCKHIFHQECLDPWLLQFWATCPLCRNRVLPEDVVTNYRQVRDQVNYDDNNDNDNPQLSLSFLHYVVLSPCKDISETILSS